MNGDEARESKEGLTTKFKITIPDIRNVTFKTCDGLDSEVEVVQYLEGGRMGPPRTARGHQLVSRLTFSHGMVSPESSQSGGKNLFDWYCEVCDSGKALTKRTVSITVEGTDGGKLVTWKVLNAWPCRWVGPLLSASSNTLTVEQVTFAHEGIIAE